MPSTSSVSAIVAAGVILAGISAGTAWAGGPSGTVENPYHISEAVGTGVVQGALVGFRATGETNDEASASMVAACQGAGGQDCTVDVVTNDDLCIAAVSDVGADIVAGGAGATVEAARADAMARAAANNTPLPPNATVVIWACP